MEGYILIVIDNNTNSPVVYKGYTPLTKKMPVFAPEDSKFQEALKDASKQLMNVYRDPEELMPGNYSATPYTYLKTDPSQNQENSINLTPGSTISFGQYLGKDLTLRIGNSSVSMYWGSDPIGAAANERLNDTIRTMLKGAVNEGGAPDMTKLTKEQNAILDKISYANDAIITQMGGIEQYESIRKMGESFDLLIRVANGQMPPIAAPVDDEIKAGLAKLGIDTSKPVYVNGQKILF